MKKSYQAPRGMRDVLPENMPAWQRLEETARHLARLFGFSEIRPPLMEETDLFTRSVGEVTDIVEKEMFSLQKGKTSLSLRPEGTAGVVRAYVQAGYAKRDPLQRLYYCGPMFRYERPQKGRERMFTQFGVECIGSSDPRLDAEVMDMAATFFEELGLTGLEVRMNSMGDGEDRDRYRDAVSDFLSPKLDDFCDLCQSRFEKNVLRVLDCKNPNCGELIVGAPVLIDFLGDENRAHFEAVQEGLRDLGREPCVDTSIVRGLDYYTRTVFEIHAPDLGARSALCGGGRYDHLVRDLGGPDVPAVGFAIGFTGTLIVFEQLGLLEGLERETADVYVIGFSAEQKAAVLQVANDLRKGGISAIYDVDERSFKAQMKAAGKGDHRYAVILGEDELARGVVQLKDLGAKSQEEVPRDGLVEAILRG
ncbi:MAG: histidine--tRNA ligase [Planctomycetota bacterium]|nr:histidine--tRNA ligase [Planctomycetota bacterium]MDG2144124.1 histidine--tRNA ligase [Planctomycetota bacterium]